MTAKSAHAHPDTIDEVDTHAINVSGADESNGIAPFSPLRPSDCVQDWDEGEIARIFAHFRRVMILGKPTKPSIVGFRVVLKPRSAYGK